MHDAQTHKVRIIRYLSLVWERSLYALSARLRVIGFAVRLPLPAVPTTRRSTDEQAQSEDKTPPWWPPGQMELNLQELKILVQAWRNASPAEKEHNRYTEHEEHMSHPQTPKAA
jgi:hypothetical protein